MLRQPAPTNWTSVELKPLSALQIHSRCHLGRSHVGGVTPDLADRNSDKVKGWRCHVSQVVLISLTLRRSSNGKKQKLTATVMLHMHSRAEISSWSDGTQGLNFATGLCHLILNSLVIFKLSYKIEFIQIYRDKTNSYAIGLSRAKVTPLTQVQKYILHQGDTYSLPPMTSTTR